MNVATDTPLYRSEAFAEDVLDLVAGAPAGEPNEAPRWLVPLVATDASSTSTTPITAAGSSGCTRPKEFCPTRSVTDQPSSLSTDGLIHRTVPSGSVREYRSGDSRTMAELHVPTASKAVWASRSAVVSMCDTIEPPSGSGRTRPTCR